MHVSSGFLFPKGRQPVLLHIQWWAIRCLLEAFFMIFNNYPNALSDVPFFAFHCSNSSVVSSFFCPSSAVGYSNFLWSSSMCSKLAFSFSLSHSLCVSQMASPKASSPRSSSAATSSSSSPPIATSLKPPYWAIMSAWSNSSSFYSPSSIITPLSLCLIQQI